MLIGIARALGMGKHPESLADIPTHMHAAGFLVDTHGEEHTDEIGMHTVLYSLQRSPYRDAPAPSCPSHRGEACERSPSGRVRRRQPGHREAARKGCSPEQLPTVRLGGVCGLDSTRGAS